MISNSSPEEASKTQGSTLALLAHGFWRPPYSQSVIHTPHKAAYHYYTPTNWPAYNRSENSLKSI